MSVSHYDTPRSRLVAAAIGIDFNGNTVTKSNSSGTTQYAWDFENRLTSVTLPNGGGVLSFKYDPLGRRIQELEPSGTTDYFYDITNVIEELDSGGNALARYTHGTVIDETLSMLRGTTALYNLADGLGSVTSLTNSAGALADTYNFGKPGTDGTFSNRS